jgi:hypothetical protein
MPYGRQPHPRTIAPRCPDIPQKWPRHPHPEAPRGDRSSGPIGHQPQGWLPRRKGVPRTGRLLRELPGQSPPRDGLQLGADCQIASWAGVSPQALHKKHAQSTRSVQIESACSNSITGSGPKWTASIRSRPTDPAFRATSGLEYWGAFRERYGAPRQGELLHGGVPTRLQAMPEVSSIVVFGPQPGRTIALLSIGGHPVRKNWIRATAWLMLQPTATMLRSRSSRPVEQRRAPRR